MKIEKARAVARLLFILFRFKLLSEQAYRSRVNYLTMLSVKYQMEERNATLSHTSEDSNQ